METVSFPENIDWCLLFLSEASYYKGKSWRVIDGSIQPVSGRFAYGSFRPRSVRLRIESIRLRLICQFAYESDVEALKLNY